ncbi:MAG: hypothetical protein AVDCRST_MAG50-910 [uncultured Acidimicrobiales bacterium]|uniref:ATP synthase protein I n=1 Tax=uncultured Acidimicrobiales bacterium TaxID=310071 RepID=A0A6J4GYF0_9ACTN|nr:MAG: hypothetical protein AVDCRST_MAG50-910 [uncultured Acidimicrobiales bacterium]
MNQGEHRELMNGFGNGLSAAFELAATPAIFGAAGYGLDRLLGTGPFLMWILGIFSVVGAFLRAWYHYDAKMRVLEAAGPWATKRQAQP